jgi:7,8-dihydro-6-hydroxymethylpterin dimethyltransferase
MRAPSDDRELIEATVGLCPFCLRRLPAQVVLEQSRVFIVRSCPEHGLQRDLLEEDSAEYLGRRRFANPATACPRQTTTREGCPFDCGLCPEHNQHTCIALIEITPACDLHCPVCYASSNGGPMLSTGTFERMLDFALESEGGQLDILQLSGGEPTLHPEWEKLVALAHSKGVKYVLLNTHGLNLLQDWESRAKEGRNAECNSALQSELLHKLASFRQGFEVYLQFDGLTDASSLRLRGRELAELKLEALHTLSAGGIPTTLVATVAAGINQHEIGSLFVQALKTPFVRGLSLQPLAYFGRVPSGMVNRTGRSTLSGIIGELEKQTKQMIRREHLVPLPCDPDQVAVGYFHKRPDGSFAPMVNRQAAIEHLPQIRNTLQFSAEEILASTPPGLCSGAGCCGALAGQIRKFFPKSFLQAGSTPEKARVVSETTFRITITSFLDTYNFELRSCRGECVHVITPELKKIPFSAYNLYHRMKAMAA